MSTEEQTEDRPAQNMRRYILIGMAIINAVMIYSAPSSTAKLLHLVIILILAALYFIYNLAQSARSKASLNLLSLLKLMLQIAVLAMFITAAVLTALSPAGA